jgi:hypothetical protein
LSSQQRATAALEGDACGSFKVVLARDVEGTIGVGERRRGLADPIVEFCRHAVGARPHDGILDVRYSIECAAEIAESGIELTVDDQDVRREVQGALGQVLVHLIQAVDHRDDRIGGVVQCAGTCSMANSDQLEFDPLSGRGLRELRLDLKKQSVDVRTGRRKTESFGTFQECFERLPLRLRGRRSGGDQQGDQQANADEAWRHRVDAGQNRRSA